MEVLIFGAVNLMLLIGVAALSLLPLYLAWELGRWMDFRFGRYWIRAGLPICFVVAVALWAFSSYRSFEHACRAMPEPQILWRPASRQMGFKVYDNYSWPPSASFAWQAALKQGLFEFVDVDRRRWCREERSPLGPNAELSLKCERYAHAPSNFSVHVLPAEKAQSWWAPIYRSEIQIRENLGNKVSATAADLIFGGGVVSLYLRIGMGDQDFSRLGCGYASKQVGPWRPTRADRIEAQRYEDADLRLLTRALIAQPNKLLQPIAQEGGATAEQ